MKVKLNSPTTPRCIFGSREIQSQEDNGICGYGTKTRRNRRAKQGAYHCQLNSYPDRLNFSIHVPWYNLRARDDNTDI
eukprot:3244907-Alexandrium_andersonii.AAC.1